MVVALMQVFLADSAEPVLVGVQSLAVHCHRRYHSGLGGC